MAGGYDGSARRPAFPREEEPVLAQFWLAPTGAFHESDDPHDGIGVIGLPRTEQSLLAAPS
jgi:hypothetical protein